MMHTLSLDNIEIKIEIKKSVFGSLNARQLDLQSPVEIEKWIDIDSDEFKRMNSKEDIWIAKYFLKAGFGSDPFLFTDELGRIWGKGDANFYPLNFEFRGKTYGHRISKKAGN